MSRPRSTGKSAARKKPREKRPARATTPGKKERAGRRASVTPLVRVTGLGGVFFRSNDPKKLMGWYRKHLGIKAGAFGVCLHTLAAATAPGMLTISGER